MTLAEVTAGRNEPGKTGLLLRPGYLERAQQQALLAALRRIFEAAPLFTPRMPRSGRPFTVRMSNCGPLGWVSDEAGYRYQPTHPVTGRPWPPMPDALMAMWNDLAGYRSPPEACLINYYGPTAKMGLYLNREEAESCALVLSTTLFGSAVSGVAAATGP